MMQLDFDWIRGFTYGDGCFYVQEIPTRPEHVCKSKKPKEAKLKKTSVLPRLCIYGEKQTGTSKPNNELPCSCSCSSFQQNFEHLNLGAGFIFRRKGCQQKSETSSPPRSTYFFPAHICIEGVAAGCDFNGTGL